MDYPAIMHYLANLLPERPEEMQVMENFARKNGFPILDPAAGQFCYLVTRMLGANTVFELGSGYGYSTAWFAMAVRDNGGGRVYHNVWDAELTQLAQRHLAVLGLNDLVAFHTGESLQALRDCPGPFDVIYNDMEKHAYPEALPVITEKLRPGGLMLADDILWNGRIFNGTDRTHATNALRRFTLQVMHDPAWSAAVVPIGNGLLMACKQ